jgi:CRISPR-associated endoribonuclease Cas6
VRLLLTLNCIKEKEVIPVNYQYPVASAIYKILKNADAEYSAFLHGKGYGKGFKLFTFSDLRCPFKIEGDRLLLLSDKAEIIVCFHLPKAAETFIKGLFMSQQLDIADKKSKAVFTVTQVESLASPLDRFNKNDEVELLLKQLSPVVCGLKNEKGNYNFLSPSDDGYEEMLFLNWEEKCKAVFEKEEAGQIMQRSFIQILFYKKPPKSRLITIKADTDAETKIRGFNNFYQLSEINVLKADHIRIQYINLSWHLPGKSNLIRNVELYMNCSNLGIIWKANKENLDPEYPSSIKPEKSYALGLRANF